VPEEHVQFFWARQGWQGLLDRYPTDAVLVPRPAPIAAALEDSAATRDSWPRAYQDATYVIHVRRGAFPECIERSRDPR
jgi:hypothetical protein